MAASSSLGRLYGRAGGGDDLRHPNGDGLTSSFYTVEGLPTSRPWRPTPTDTAGLINVPVGAATVVTSLANPHTDLGTISLLGPGRGHHLLASRAA